MRLMWQNLMRVLRPPEPDPASLSCLGCGYDLRGLVPASLCPECGCNVLRSWVRREMDRLPGNVRQRDEAVDAIWKTIASVTPFPSDALRFVYDALQTPGAGNFYGSILLGSRGIGAREVCDRVRRYALEYFGDAEEAGAVLEAWNVSTSRDVGRIVFALVDAGWLATSPGDSLSDFEGLVEDGAWFGETDG